jgi:hypothetical protein
MNPIEELDKIIRLAQDAKAALADEHEGAMRKAVLELDTRAQALAHLVLTW